jgi:signal transduction histidine kinase
MVKTRHIMKNHRARQAGFGWQACLIAAPVAILSAIAFYSLRLDRASIEQDARDHARSLASTLAEQWGQALYKDLTDQVTTQNFMLRSLGKGGQEPPTPIILQGLIFENQVLYPLEYSQLPAPPNWLAQLTPAQSQLWRAMEEAVFQKRDTIAAGKALAALKAGGLPESACANAEFNWLLLDSSRPGAPDPDRRFLDLARRYPAAETEAGTPLGDLALLQALRHTSPDGEHDVLAETAGRVTGYPSFMTSDLLKAAEWVHGAGYIYENTWRAEEKTRELLREFVLQPERTGEIWFQAGGERFLALCSPSIGKAIHVEIISGTWLEERCLSLRTSSRSQIPEYAGIIAKIGNWRWPVESGRSLSEKTELPAADLLASAAGEVPVRSNLTVPVIALRNRLKAQAPGLLKEIPDWPDKGDINTIHPISAFSRHPLVVSLILGNPDLLYARYRLRLWLTAGLICAAAAAAGIGLLGAWRAFQRQVRLAEMTSNFVSSVSHELRTPLASVRLMAESLDQGRVAEVDKRNQYFKLIVQECRRLSSLVENVLDFSRIHQGRKRYEFEPIDLAALLRQTVGLLEPNAAEHQVSLVLVGLPPAVQELQPHWDGQAVQQAIVNLVDNAIKHSPAGKTVQVACVMPDDSEIHITVEDQGSGIPEAEQERIFEPFYRRGSELRRETKGIGIGLSIVKHVAEAHGGRVSVTSTPGQGSRFTLELPPRPDRAT